MHVEPRLLNPMNERNTKYLVETYAPLYERCPVFECLDGWFDIIDELSKQIHYIILKTECTCRVSQVKEKFGTLRYYMTTSTDEMHKYIEIAYRKSSVTCEACGEPGKLVRKAWLSTYCNRCAKANDS